MAVQAGPLGQKSETLSSKLPEPKMPEGMVQAVEYLLS
jgi:hypothetical protein